MTDDHTAVALPDDDTEERVWVARCHGISVRKICKEFGIPPKVVHQIVDQRVPEIDDKLRRRMLALDLDRLDRLYSAFFNKALAGDLGAGLFCLRIQERRACYLNLDHAPSRQDQPTVVIAATPGPSSTERIRAAIHAVRQGRQKPGLAESCNGEGAVVPEDSDKVH